MLSSSRSAALMSYAPCGMPSTTYVSLAAITSSPSQSSPQASLSVGLFGDDGVELDPSVVWRIDANTGRFQGTPPPTNAIEGVFAPLVAQLLPGVTITASIDSVRYRATDEFACGAADAFFGAGGCSEFFVTFSDGTNSESFQVLAKQIQVDLGIVRHVEAPFA